MAQAAVQIEAEAAIDRAHLARMTLGDRSLEQEVLQLFDRQAALLIERMRTGDAAVIGTLAHTLKGSAAGIGATDVARAAEILEQTARHTPDRCGGAIDQLAMAVSEARSTIATLLRP